MRRRRLLGICTAFVLLALAGAAGAAPNPVKRSPSLLWKSYPLKQRTAASQPHLPLRPPALAVGTGSSSGGGFTISTTLWLLIAAALAAFVGAIALISGAAPPRWPWAGVRLRAAAGDFAGNVAERVRLIAWEPERGLRAIAKHRPQIRLRGDVSTRNGKREGSVAAALLDVLPRASEVREPVDRGANAASGPPAPTREDATLKRKGAVANGDPVEKLKKKAVVPGSENKHRHDVTVLKAKLAEEEGMPVARARAVVGTRRGERDARRKQRELTAPSTSTGATLNRAAPVPLTAHCRIDWWRGYVKSEFHAKVKRPDGSESVVMISPSFRWGRPIPPPSDLPRVLAAHAALVRALESAGWVATGRGDEWFAIELKRRVSLAARERKE